MKKQSIIYCFLLFISSTLFAQTINHYNELGGGWIGSDPEDDTYIEGTRNLYDDFRPGVVYYNDNSDALQVSLRLNLYNDEFEYVNNDTLHVLKDLNHLEKL
jgi:hypothetical protein